MCFLGLIYGNLRLKNDFKQKTLLCISLKKLCKYTTSKKCADRFLMVFRK